MRSAATARPLVSSCNAAVTGSPTKCNASTLHSPLRCDNSNKPLRVATESLNSASRQRLCHVNPIICLQRHIESLPIMQQAAVQKDCNVFTYAALFIEHVTLQRRLPFK